jgi:hypothetical protein
MKNLLSIIFVLVVSVSFSQEELSSKEIKKFQIGEKVLREYMLNFAYDTIPFETRVKKIHDFIPRFVALLKEKNSYLYPFDSLQYLSKVKAPDNAFKVFTWELKEPLGTHRYYGAVQMNSKNLKITPLFDYSDTMVYHPQKTLTPANWYGCIYYNCTLTKDDQGNKKYTLFGLDRIDYVSNRKIMEVMTINSEDKILFGEETLLHYYDTLGRLIKKEARLFLQYNDRSVVHLNYNQAKQEIIYDHITAPTEKEADASFTYVPDGTYEGFTWENNYWKSDYRVFKQSINKPDSPPMPHPQNNGSRKNMLGQ